MAPVIVPALGLTGVGAAVASLAINVALSFVVSRSSRQRDQAYLKGNSLIQE